MAHLQMDREDDGKIAVSWHTINGRKVRRFADRKEAETYAIAKMGKTGSIIDTLDMTPEQLAEQKAREARARALMEAMQ